MKEALDISRQLGDLNYHHETPAQQLGIGNGGLREVAGSLDAIESRRLLSFSDGSHLYQMDQAVFAMLQADVPSGSIIEVAVMHEPPRTAARAQGFLAYATEAVVVAHHPGAIELIGLVRQPRAEEKAQGRQQGAWGTYAAQGIVFDEKQDAIETLARLYSIRVGSEGSQMISLLDTDLLHTESAGKRIGEAGCFSHERPKEALPHNMMIGSTMMRTAGVTADDSRLIVRLRHTANTTRLAPLACVDDPIDEIHLWSIRLAQRAQKIAASNPLGFGRGTSAELVQEKMLATIGQLPELVGNEATIEVLARQFAGALGIR